MKMFWLYGLFLALLLSGCAGGANVDRAPTPPDFSVVDATSDTVTIRSNADPDDPFIVAEAQRLCSAFGKNATYFSSHDSDKVDPGATAFMRALGSSGVAYVTDHLFLCR